MWLLRIRPRSSCLPCKQFTGCAIPQPRGNTLNSFFTSTYFILVFGMYYGVGVICTYVQVREQLARVLYFHMWVPAIRLRSSSLVASTITHWATSPSLVNHCHCHNPTFKASQIILIVPYYPQVLSTTWLYFQDHVYHLPNLIFIIYNFWFNCIFLYLNQGYVLTL